MDRSSRMAAIASGVCAITSVRRIPPRSRPIERPECDRVPLINRKHRMELYILSAVGLPCMALAFFVLLEAAFSSSGIWAVLSDAGLDLCRISIGIVGAMFLDVQIRGAAGTVAAGVLLLELIFAAGAMLVERRATDLGIVRQSTRAFGILAFGIVAMVIPAVLIALNGGH